MSEPIVFISHHKIKPGQLEGLRRYTREGLPLIEAGKPGTLAMLTYLNEDDSEVSFIHIFPNSPAMDDHMQGANDRARGAFEFVEPQRYEIYGMPSDETMAIMKAITGSGVELRVDPGNLGGFMRLKSG